MNFKRARVEHEKNFGESSRIEVPFDMDDAIQKVGKPSNSKKWKDKEAIIAREMQEQGFSQSQIAEYLDCSRSTIRRRLKRLRPKYSWESE